MKDFRPLSATISRHGILPVHYPQTKKILADRYRIFSDTTFTFSCRRRWLVLVRIWLEINLIGDEIQEWVEGVEVAPDGQLAAVDISPAPAPDIRWVDKPPVKLSELKPNFETGISFVEKSIAGIARELQNKQLTTRLPALERMRAYYRQLADDAGNSSSQTDAIQAEYQRRLREEVRFARVKATVNPIALETISTPVQQLKWVLQRKSQTREVISFANLYTGKMRTPVRCDCCGNQTHAFGLSRSSEVVCINCRNCSDRCRLQTQFTQSKGGDSQPCRKANDQMTLFKDHPT